MKWKKLEVKIWVFSSVDSTHHPKICFEATKKMYYFFPQGKVYTDVLQYHTVTLQCSVLNFFF